MLIPLLVPLMWTQLMAATGSMQHTKSLPAGVLQPTQLSAAISTAGPLLKQSWFVCVTSSSDMFVSRKTCTVGASCCSRCPSGVWQWSLLEQFFSLPHFATAAESDFVLRGDETALVSCAGL